MQIDYPREKREIEREGKEERKGREREKEKRIFVVEIDCVCARPPLGGTGRWRARPCAKLVAAFVKRYNSDSSRRPLDAGALRLARRPEVGDDDDEDGALAPDFECIGEALSSGLSSLRVVGRVVVQRRNRVLSSAVAAAVVKLEVAVGSP